MVGPTMVHPSFLLIRGQYVFIVKFIWFDCLLFFFTCIFPADFTVKVPSAFTRCKEYVTININIPMHTVLD